LTRGILAQTEPKRQNTMSNYLLAQLDEIETQRCPCGFTRRAFVTPDNPIATLHLLDVQSDAQKHYHKTLTEIYLILEGNGQMELDDDIVPVKPMTAILIKPGCRHRAIGNLRVVIIPIPAFDPADKWFD
jgi:mannose-6-phosphate isomerase-like protein (cupin superfamily)